MRKYLFALSLACVACLGVSARMVAPMSSVRMLLGSYDEMPITDDIVIEGVVLVDAGNPNMSLTSQRHFSYMRDYTARENYLSARDGSCGFRLLFDRSGDAAALRRGNVLRLNLNGTILEQDGAGSVTVRGLTAAHIEAVEAGSPDAVPVNARSIARLKPSDYNTWVSIPECELVFKDGSLSNIYETYAFPTALNKSASPNGYMDPWGSLLCDRSGGLCYMIINTRCPWRRDGTVAPQGSGTVSGVLVHNVLTRYDMGDYQLRPMAREDIAIQALPVQEDWRVAALWTWGDNAAEFTTDRGRRKNIVHEAVLPDEGQGSLRVETRGTIYRGLDMNNPRIEPRQDQTRYGVRGRMDRGALSIDTEASAWWNWEEDRGNGIIIRTSLEQARGSRLLFAVAFAAGKIHSSSSYAYPSWWGVEYSTDGRTWKRVDTAFRLRSYPWWHENDIGGVQYFTSYEAGLGATEHAVLLPTELLGEKDVWIRFAPAGRVVSSLAASDQDQILLQRNMSDRPTVNFCSFAIRYR